MKFKIFVILLLIFAAIYWRGTKQLLTEKNLSCNFKTVYALCLTDSKKVKDGVDLKFMDIMKAGVKFN